MPKKKSSGLTLLEVLIFITVSGIAGVLLVSTLVQNNNLFFDQSVKISQGLNINDATAVANDSIREAVAVASSYTSYTSGSEILVVKIPSYDSSGNTIPNTFDYLVLTKDQAKPKIFKKLIFPDIASKRPAEDKVLLTNLSSIRFTYFNDSGVEVAPNLATKVSYILNVADTVGRNTQTSSSSSQLNIRNN